MEIIVYSEKSRTAAETVAYAKQLGATNVKLVALGKATDEALCAGADEVLEIALPEDARIEDAANTIAGLVNGGVFMVGVSRSGRALGARVAALLDCAVVAGIEEASFADGVSVTWTQYGGMQAQTLAGSLPIVLVVEGGKAEAIQAQAAPVREVPFVAPTAASKVLGTEVKQKSSVDLTASEIVVCVGRGAASVEQIELCKQLAEAIGGDLACSRPVTEGEEPLMPTELYIGASGVTVKPKVYIGVGVSGQTQHTVGMRDSEVVVSINKDKDCLLFRQADYCVEGDLNAIVPALTAALS